MYYNATIPEITRAVRGGEVSCRELVREYLDRIAQLDSCEGGLNSVLEVNPDALSIARMVDAQKPSGDLAGAAILLKDNIDTTGAMHTSAGSVALASRYAPRDATVAARLRDAGAVILGKANMTEFANAMADDMPNGYSSRGGQVRGISSAVADPSGSSTGSAVAVAAGLCTAAIGTETCGSIMSPAWNAGIVGMKPTAGLVSRAGILPISRTLDTAGPMARTVHDALLVLRAIAGPDPRDPATLCQPDGCLDDPGELPLAGARIGVSRSFMDQVAEDGREGMQMALGLLPALEAAGAVLVDADLPVAREGEMSPGAVFEAIFRYEMRASIDAYFASNGEAMTLGDIIRYNSEHAEAALRYGQAVLERAQAASGRLTEVKYIEALTARECWIDRIDALFERERLDILLSIPPTLYPPVLGFPAVTLPIGLNGAGAPVGSYWIGPRFGDMRLLRLGGAIERAIAAPVGCGA